MIEYFKYFAMGFGLTLLSSTNALPNISGQMAVSSIVDSIDSMIDDSIANINNAVDSNTFLAIQRLKLLSKELNEIAENNVDKVFANISSVEQQILQDTMNALSSFESTSSSIMSDVNRVINDANGLMGSVPFMNKSPRVEKYGPRFYLVDEASKGASVVFSGYFLDHGKPSMSIEGGTCNLTSNTRNRTEFQCGIEDADLNGIREVLSLPGEVSFEREMTWWQSIKSVFFDNREFKVYPISLYIVPAAMGEIEVIATVQTKRVEISPRSQDFHDSNGHCAGSRVRTFNFEAASGWEIDPNSISVSCNSSSKSACNGIRNVSSTSFQYEGRVSNNGQCGPKIPFTNERTYYDGRGSVGGKANWNDVREIPDTVTTEVARRDLHWRRDVSLDLPIGSKSFILRIKQIDGREVVINSTQGHKWFDVVANIPNRQLIIRPKSAEIALQ